MLWYVCFVCVTAINKDCTSEAGEIPTRSSNRRSQVLHTYLYHGQGSLTKIVLQCIVPSFCCEWMAPAELDFLCLIKLSVSLCLKLFSSAPVQILGCAVLAETLNQYTYIGKHCSRGTGPHAKKPTPCCWYSFFFHLWDWYYLYTLKKPSVDTISAFMKRVFWNDTSTSMLTNLFRTTFWVILMIPTRLLRD